MNAAATAAYTKDSAAAVTKASRVVARECFPLMSDRIEFS